MNEKESIPPVTPVPMISKSEKDFTPEMNTKRQKNVLTKESNDEEVYDICEVINQTNRVGNDYGKFLQNHDKGERLEPVEAFGFAKHIRQSVPNVLTSQWKDKIEELGCKVDDDNLEPMENIFPNQTIAKVIEWLDQIPSSLESPKSDVHSSVTCSNSSTKSTSSYPSMKISTTKFTTSKTTRIEERIIKNHGGEKYKTIEPTPPHRLNKTIEVKEKDRKLIDCSNISNNRKKLHSSGSTTWTNKPPELKRKSNNNHQSSSLRRKRFIGWFGNLCLVQWLFKKKEKSEKLIKDSSENISETFATFTPYQNVLTADGVELPSQMAFGGDGTQSQVKSAVNAISSKLRNESLKPHAVNHLGNSDAEFILPKEMTSVEELNLLTDLLNEKRQSRTNKRKMHSIFAVHKNYLEESPNPYETGIIRGEYHQSRLHSLWMRFRNGFQTRTQGVVEPYRAQMSRNHRFRVHPYLPNQQQHLLARNNIASTGEAVIQQNREEVGPLRNFMNNVTNTFKRIFGREPEVAQAEPIRVDYPPCQIRRRRGIHSSTLHNLRQQFLEESQGSIIAPSPLRSGILREVYPEDYQPRILSETRTKP